MGVHEAAAEGFRRGAADYERGRPSYPPAAVAHVVAALGLGPGATVVDLGAGTGKMTRLLLPTGADVVAVEPVAAMREQLVGAVRGVDVREGTAEALPLPDQAADAVVVAQAAHWFDLPVALREVRRVLRPGGGLALLWNQRDATVAWVEDLNAAVGWRERTIPRYEEGEADWTAALDASGLFGPVEVARFPYAHRLDEDTLVARMLSTSYVATLPQEGRQEAARRVRAVVAGFPPEFDLPYVTIAYTCRRR